MKFHTYARYFLLALLAATSLAACKEDGYLYYNGASRIQFEGPADTLRRHTFYYDEATVTEDTVFFDVIALGGVKNTDRTFTLIQEQLPGETNAEPGVHYVPFNDPRAARNYVVRAGSVLARVPVILLRDESLRTGTMKLKLAVQPDDNFQQGELSLRWRKVEFTDKLSQPSSWDAWMVSNAFGKYSLTKHEFMIRATGDKWDAEFFTWLRSDEAARKYYQTTLKTALINYNNLHPSDPLRDEFGDLIVFQ